MSISLSAEIIEILAPAFCAGLVVASTHVPLGQEVLRRGIIFIDLAVAQIAALGTVAAHVWFQTEGSSILPVLFALGFALAAGRLFAWLEKAAPAHQEALIGSAFVISASLAIMMLANDPYGGEHMQGLLAGQILWVSWKQVALTGLVYALVLALWFGLKDKRGTLFFLLFPVVITLSVQLVGVYLVFASLIIPALGALRFRRRLLAGYVLAFGALAYGLIISVSADLPSGPVIVCSYALGALACILFKRKRGPA